MLICPVCKISKTNLEFKLARGSLKRNVDKKGTDQITILKMCAECWEKHKNQENAKGAGQ